jgi:transcriptional regulator with XRE-family HTH domain
MIGDPGRSGVVVRRTTESSNYANQDVPSVGEQVRRLRTAAGLTQYELANRTGSTQPAVAHLEAGRRTPTLATLEKVARALGHDLVVVLPCGLVEQQVSA